MLEPSTSHNGRIWAADRILVPASKIREAILRHSGDSLQGHLGLRKTFDLLDRKFSRRRVRQNVPRVLTYKRRPATKTRAFQTPPVASSSAAVHFNGGFKVVGMTHPIRNSDTFDAG